MANELKNRTGKDVVDNDGEATKNDKKKADPVAEQKKESTASNIKVKSPPTNDWDLVVGTFQPYLYPLMAIFVLAISLRPYSVADYNDLLTDKFLLFGFDNLEKLRKHVVDNVIGSCVWGFTYLYVRRAMNPEFRKKIPNFIQDGFYGTLATFCTGFLKAVVMNFLGK